MFAAAIREHRSMGKIPSWLTTFGIILGRCCNIPILRYLPLCNPQDSNNSKNINVDSYSKKDKLKFNGYTRIGSLSNVVDSLCEARKIMHTFTTPFLFV